MSVVRALFLSSGFDPKPPSPSAEDTAAWRALMLDAYVRSNYRGVLSRGRYVASEAGPSIRSGNPLTMAMAFIRGASALQATSPDPEIRLVRALIEIACERSRAPLQYLQGMRQIEDMLERGLEWSRRHGLVSTGPSVSPGK